MANKFSSGLCSIVLVLLVALPLGASIADWKSFDQKTSEADAIVLGEMISSESRLDPDGQWIRTWTTFRVTDVLKGDGATGTVTIVTPGGTVDGIHQESVGTPSFAPGTEQILFLKASPEAMTPLYLEQGVYDVTRDERDRALVRPVATDLVLYDDQTGRIIPAEATRDLESFRSEIRASLDRQERRVARAASIDTMPAVVEDDSDFFRENAMILVLFVLGIAIAFITWIRKQ